MVGQLKLEIKRRGRLIKCRRAKVREVAEVEMGMEKEIKMKIIERMKESGEVKKFEQAPNQEQATRKNQAKNEDFKMADLDDHGAGSFGPQQDEEMQDQDAELNQGRRTRRRPRSRWSAWKEWLGKQLNQQQNQNQDQDRDQEMRDGRWGSKDREVGQRGLGERDEAGGFGAPGNQARPEDDGGDPERGGGNPEGGGNPGASDPLDGNGDPERGENGDFQQLYDASRLREDKYRAEFRRNMPDGFELPETVQCEDLATTFSPLTDLEQRSIEYYGFHERNNLKEASWKDHLGSFPIMPTMSLFWTR